MSVINGASGADVLGQYRLQDEKVGGGSDLGKNEFMELMIAQLKNQNPLKPQENGEFIAQLAQFSSLEEMQKVSSSIDDVVGEFRSTQALQASAMVGQSVLVPSGSGMLGADGSLSGSISVPVATDGLKLSVQSPSGELVRIMNLGRQGAGEVAFEWDGRDGNGNALPPGRYSLIAEGSYSAGNEQLETSVSANVDSVSLGGAGRITLNLAGMGSIALSDVQQIN